MFCNRTILTTAVAVQGDNLVLTLPAGTYRNCGLYNIRIAQPIPATATNLLAVAIQIGTDATLYPVRRKCGHALYANQVRTRRVYGLRVAADTQTFTVVSGCIYGDNVGVNTALPVPAAAEGAAVVPEVNEGA